MRRRALLLLAGAASLVVMAGRAFPQTGRIRRIAFLSPGSQAAFRIDAFRGALKDRGYLEGRDISIATRWADGRVEQLSVLAREVIASNPDVVVTASSAAVAACKKATSSIPIVFATVGDPVEQGFVSSLQRPGGNITGVIALALYPKIVELAREAFPSATRLGVLVHDADPFHRTVIAEFEPNARRLKFDPVVVRLARAEDLQRAFEDLSGKADAVIVPTLALFSSNLKQVAAFGLKSKLPLISPHDYFARAGGLLSDGSPRTEHYRRAAALVDKILRGAKPRDLAVEQPERIELVVNRRTAQAIGVKLSPVTMLRADRVIE